MEPNYDRTKGNFVTDDTSADQVADEWPPKKPFEEVAALVEECKERGIMLDADVSALEVGESVYFAPYARGGTQYLRRCTPKPRTIPNERLPEGLWPEEQGSIPVTPDLLAELNQSLQDDESEVRKISNWFVERSFVYLDISDFSRFPPGQQALVINSVTQIRNNHRWPPQLHNHSPERTLCIGDGYIFVFKDAVIATGFATALASKIDTFVSRGIVPIEFHFRMGIHVGPVYSFWDMGRNDWNYVGEGINGGNRVISVIGKDVDDVLFISLEVRQKVLSATSTPFGPRFFDGKFQNRGRREDKHGNPWRVFEVDHMATWTHFWPHKLS